LVLFNKCQYIICVLAGGAFFTFKQMKKVSKAKQGFKFTNSKLSVKYRIKHFNEKLNETNYTLTEAIFEKYTLVATWINVPIILVS
jgi:hypothetical protein